MHGLADAPCCWYLRAWEELSQTDCNASQLDNGSFFWIKDGSLCGIIFCFVADLLWGGTDEFSVFVISKIHKVFTIGSKCIKAFIFIGIHAHKNHYNKSE